MDRKTVKKVETLLNYVAKKYNIVLKEAIIFGSRVRKDYQERSDIDLLLVSPDFKDVAWNKRPGPFYEEWNYKELPEPEFICLTPEEFEEQRKIDAHIVQDAVKKGVAIR